MTRIRVKNKHLIFALAFVLVTMGAVSVFGGDYLFYRAQRASRAGDKVQALAYYDALIERYPKHSRVPEALYWSADLLPSFDTFTATFFPHRSAVTTRVGGVAELPAGSLTRIERYLRIQEEYPTHPVANHVDYRLADAYHTLGDPRSEELYLQALYKQRATSRLDAALRLIQIYEGQNRLDDALAVIEYCQVELPNHSPMEIKIKLGDVLALQGDYSGARQAYEEVLVIARKTEEELRADPRQDLHAGEPLEVSIVPHYERQIEAKLASLSSQVAGEFAELRGQVTLLGKPFGGVYVYANRILGDERSYYGGSEPGLWITSEDGTFFGNLPTGSYEVGINLNYSQAQMVVGTHLQILNGELDLTAEGESPLVEFRFVEPIKLNQPTSDLVYSGGPMEIKWDAYPGAHEYSISVAGVTVDSGGGTSYITTNVGKTTGQTSFLYNGRTVNSFGVIGYDPEGVHPAYLIGRPEGYDRLRIVVSALDEEGNTLASSSGLHFGGDTPVMGEVVVQAGLRSEAEQLLFDRKYDQAVALLEKRVEDDPSGVDALWILARIYFSGTHGAGEAVWDERNFAHRDLKKSLEVLQRIRSLQPGIEVEEAIETVQRSLSA